MILVVLKSEEDFLIDIFVSAFKYITCIGCKTFISVLFLLSDWLIFFFIVAESSMQKLNHALRILSETEKQLRISKNQTTWFTAALLQLSSIEYSSVDANDTKLCIGAASNRGRLGLNALVDGIEFC